MKLNPLKKPSPLCGKCKELGGACYCLCHQRPYVTSYHEIISEYPMNQKVEKVTKFESEYTIFDKIKKRLGFSV